MKDTDDIGSNQSPNPHIIDLIRVRVTRRSAIAGSLAVAASGFFAGSTLISGEAAAHGRRSRLRFAEVPTSDLDDVVVPEGYTWDVLVPWGTELFKKSPTFAEDASNTAADQTLQVGFNHDGMHYFPLDKRRGERSRGLLALNHEYTDATQIYTAEQGSAITPDAAGVEKVKKALAGHGVTIVEIRQLKDATWTHVVGSAYNRRITGETRMKFAGPVKGEHPALQSNVCPEPKGTLNNCAHGYTPWGTYLTCEENWNGYFGTTDANYVPTDDHKRYGVNATGFGYNWHIADSRFDIAGNPNEVNRFGWVVEIDPFDPKGTPVKRTALGRIKHEGATVVERRGKVVVYSGDDENGEYLYKFESSAPWRWLRARGKSPLDHGTLYVARFNEDGTGEWLPLVHGTGPLTSESGWIDQADVLLRTRMAADAVGATKLHRPEWVAGNSRTNDIYVTLTNGTGNNSAVNSDRDPNPYGHILRLSDDCGEDETFTWEVFLLAGDPAYDAAVPAEQSVFGSPDGLFVDPDGLIWIQTDISNSSQNRADRGYDNIGNNMMLVADPETREVRRFLTGPRGCEITGVVLTPDQKTMFINVQHPGESTTHWNNMFGAPSTANPNAVSSWPFGGRPRPATIAIRRIDGRKIGR